MSTIKRLLPARHNRSTVGRKCFRGNFLDGKKPPTSVIRGEALWRGNRPNIEIALGDNITAPPPTVKSEC